MQELRQILLGAAALALGLLITSGCAASTQPAQPSQPLQATMPAANTVMSEDHPTRPPTETPCVPITPTLTFLPITSTSVPAAPMEGIIQPDKTTPKVDKSQFKKAPTLSSTTWINSPPLTLDSLRGHVVIVSFWTFACYNCQNTLPYFKAWDARYRDHGLVIIGVHTPELSFERDVANVKQAVREDGIQYPIAVDGDYANWNRYHVQAWPTWFILDKEGYIRYSHVGEGDYSRSEKTIVELLQE